MTRMRDSANAVRLAKRSLRHAARLNDTAVNSAAVIAERLSLTPTVARTPAETALEFARMAPEKAIAFASAANVMGRRSAAMSRRGVALCAAEVTAAQAAMAKLTTCRTPMEAALVQSNWVMGAWTRMASNGWALGLMATSSAAAALKPIRKTVKANAARLGV